MAEIKNAALKKIGISYLILKGMRKEGENDYVVYITTEREEEKQTRQQISKNGTIRGMKGMQYRDESKAVEIRNEARLMIRRRGEG